MSLFDLLPLIGGLALFLYGMNLMSVGLTRQSGSRLQGILEHLTSSRFKGVILGAGVTAIIQSSSATTVMMVGLVNAGIIGLNRAIPVIMGANVGTTVTAWILSLVGLEGSSPLLKMLNPMSFTPLLAITGVAFILFSKDEKKNNLARILLGFAVLMYGMDSMSAAVTPLAKIEGFQRLFLAFSNPLLGILVGMGLTAIIQSSSASVGILQALSRAGAVSFGAAIPIIMGQNIGTTVTAMISSIGANRNARRAAVFHLSFNVLSTLVFTISFYSLEALLKFNFLDDTINPVWIAIVQTLFNFLGMLILLPFTNLLEKLTRAIIPSSEEDRIATEIEERFKLLDERFFDTPALAIEQCLKLGRDMTEKTQKGLLASLELLSQYSSEGLAEVMALEDLVDRYEDKLGSYMVRLTARELQEEEYKTVNIWLQNINDLERISDHTVHIARSAEEMHQKNLIFSEEARAEMEIYIAAVVGIVEIAFRALNSDDLELATRVEPLEEVIDRLNDELQTRHINRLTNGKCTLEHGFIFNDLITSLERVADHCSNISVSMIEIHADGFNTHEYLAQVKNDSSAFRKMYDDYRDVYRLPPDMHSRSNGSNGRDESFVKILNADQP